MQNPFTVLHLHHHGIIAGVVDGDSAKKDARVALELHTAGEGRQGNELTLGDQSHQSLKAAIVEPFHVIKDMACRQVVTPRQSDVVSKADVHDAAVWIGTSHPTSDQEKLRQDTATETSVILIVAEMA